MTTPSIKPTPASSPSAKLDAKVQLPETSEETLSSDNPTSSDQVEKNPSLTLYNMMGFAVQADTASAGSKINVQA